MSEPQPNSNSVTDNVKKPASGYVSDKSNDPQGDPSITSSADPSITSSDPSNTSPDATSNPPITSSIPDATTSPATISEEPKVPISRNFLQLSNIVLDKTGENKGRVVLSNKLVYFGPIEVIDEPLVYTVLKMDGTTEPYSINVIKISDQGRLQQGEQSVPTDDNIWKSIALPINIDKQNLSIDDLPKDADGKEIQWVSYVMYDIFSSFANNSKSSSPREVFKNEMVEGFFNAEYNEDVMFNKANLKKLQIQTFKDLVIYFNALMETLDHIYTHSISSVLNPEKKECLTDLQKNGSSSASGNSSAITTTSASATASNQDEQMLSQIEKLYNKGKVKEIDEITDKIVEDVNNPINTKISLYVILTRLETGQVILKDKTLTDLYTTINNSINQINSFTNPEEKTKYTRIIFKILFYTYQDDTIQETNNLLNSSKIVLLKMDSKLEMVFNANTIKQILNNNIDTQNPDIAKREADDLMDKYDLQITAADKTDYEKEISDTTAAAQKAKADLKWTLAELLFKRAYQLAVVYFGYDSEQEGAAKLALNNFVDLNKKNGSRLIKFVGNLSNQLTMPGSVYDEFLETDNKEPPIIDDKQDIPKKYKDEIDAIITAQMATRVTRKQLFEDVPDDEIQKQLPGAIIGTLSGIISNMIIQMTLYIYIVNQLRIKEIGQQGDDAMDNNEIILLFNILAGLKIAEQRIIALSSEQNKDSEDLINIPEETQVNSAFLNKLMGSVLASGSMLGVLAAVGGKSKSRKKRRPRGLKSRRLNKSNSKRYKKGKGITRRYLRKGKTTRKLRKHN